MFAAPKKINNILGDAAYASHNDHKYDHLVDVDSGEVLERVDQRAQSSSIMMKKLTPMDFL